MSQPPLELCVPASHPCLPGHFPGRPVVPGVLLLELVSEAIQTKDGLRRLAGIPQVKFLAPVFPDEPFQVTWSTDGSRSRFGCTARGSRVAEGVLVWKTAA